MKPADDASPSTGYGTAAALLTDLYELTMACGYWKSGIAEREAAFHLAFRKPPFGSGFSVACGLATAIDYLENLRFTESDLVYLAGIPGRDGCPLFGSGFLDFLKNFRFTCNVRALPEGTVVFPHEPLLCVEGPIFQAQIIETALLNILNFQTLIATKAARICLSTGGDSVLEFGLRRAQGIDGGISATRAAFVGGCRATSNLLAGQRFGIPVAGTHAHSWVMLFESELEAFSAYASAMPNNCILLVDTYDSLQGVRHAVEIGKRLRENGHEFAGIRLDSGDLAFLSIEARKILDAAGFEKAAIVASNDLDEHVIASLKQQGARINVWGVGTRLVTAYDEPALGGVYKLAAIRDPNGTWQPRLKISEQKVKTTTPGVLQVRRFCSDSEFIGDAIYDLSRPTPAAFTIVDPLDSTRRKQFETGVRWEDLLVSVFQQGHRVYQPPALAQSRELARQQLEMLHPGIKRSVNPHQYPAGLELSLHELKTRMVLQARKGT